MTSIADLVQDRFLLHNVNLQRFEAGERAKVREALLPLRDKLALKLGGMDDTEVFNRKRLAAIFKATDQVIKQTYDGISKKHDGMLMKLANVESKAAAQILNSTIGVSLLTGGLNEATIKAIVNDDIVLGLPAKEHWQKQENNLRARFQNQIRQGVFAGETLGQLKQRIRGTKANAFKDGIMEVTSRDAEALVRTSVQSISNAARHQTYQDNSDVIKGQQ